MSKSLRLEFQDASNNKETISISEPKDDVTKAEASALGKFLIDQTMIEGKKANLASYQKAFLITRTEIELV